MKPLNRKYCSFPTKECCHPKKLSLIEGKANHWYRKNREYNWWELEAEEGNGKLKEAIEVEIAKGIKCYYEEL